MDKIIKLVIFVFVLIIVLLGCFTNKEEIVRSKSIQAGQTDIEVLYQNFTPDLQINIQC